jgi:hypothetical protein
LKTLLSKGRVWGSRLKTLLSKGRGGGDIREIRGKEGRRRFKRTFKKTNQKLDTISS